MTISTIAPIVAITRLPISPPAVRPSVRKREPPMNAPTTPMMMSPSTPKPLPFTNCPASQPATSPMIRNQTNSICALLAVRAAPRLALALHHDHFHAAILGTTVLGVVGSDRLAGAETGAGDPRVRNTKGCERLLHRCGPF